MALALWAYPPSACDRILGGGCAVVPDVGPSVPRPRQCCAPYVASVLIPIPTVSVEPPLASGFCGGVEAAWHAASGCVPLQVPNLPGLLVLVSS